MTRGWSTRPTGGSAASSPAAGTAEPVWLGQRWRPRWTRSSEAGGGIVEAYPEQVEDRGPQRGAYFHTGPETLFEDFGFTRQRQIAKWRWVMRLDVVGSGPG